ncbi:MAG TPA: RNA methyltransferase [Ignavibacteria bacterium]|nr:RNA methyltransferase [Ignavibacteria bacterium]
MTLTKAQIKSIANLGLKKFRNIENKFLIEGERAVRDGLNSDYNYELILVTKEYLDKNPNYLKENKKVEILNNNDFQKISGTVNPQGIAAVFLKPVQNENWMNEIKTDLVVCLDCVTDPGNVGTIIRNCDWFGIREIILGNSCADLFNPKTIRASMGAIFNTNVFKSNNLSEDLKNLKTKSYKIISATLEGKNIFDYKQREKLIVILGNEANGISNEILNISDEFVTIPKKGAAESLNVANASAVILAELTKEM